MRAPRRQLSRKGRRESARRLILVAIGWWLLAELSGVPIGIIVGALKYAHFQNASITHPITLTVTMWLAGCMLLIAVRERSFIVGHGNRRAGVGDGPITRWWLLIVLALLVAIWAFIAAAFWNAVVPQWLSTWRGQSAWTQIAFAVAAVILSPFAEELFFRGWLWTGLRQHWRAFPTALLSSSLWLVVHLERGLLVPILLIPIAIILGFARHFCGIRASIILHALYNLVAVLLLGLLLVPTT
jgi:membrane protease YdiL (CAAX protease family)